MINFSKYKIRSSWKQRVTRTENDIAKAVDRFLSGVTKIGDVFWLLLLYNVSTFKETDLES